jgi:hypothetical protein
VTDRHDGQRVSRRSLVRGVAALGLGGVLAACSRDPDGTPVKDAVVEIWHCDAYGRSTGRRLRRCLRQQ